MPRPADRPYPRARPNSSHTLIVALTLALLAALMPTTDVGAENISDPVTSAIGQGDFNDEFVAGSVNRAVAADWLPDGRALVLEQTGRIVVMDPQANSTTPWIQITDLDADAENGSLDFVVDNNFNGTRHIFVYYKARSDGRLRIGRFTFNDSSDDIGTEQVVWSNPGPAHSTWGGTNHIGGSLTIGPDARLYLTIGDGFHAPNAQSLDSVFGKILRINKDGSVPADNPFYDGDGPNIDEIYALGVRNPWRANWDYQTGRLWVGDVGGNEAITAYEEVNLIEPGRNYGWPLCEGPLTGPKNGPDCPDGVTGPVWSYPHAIDEGCCFNASITGGNIVRGTISPLEGDYIFADYARGDISALDLNGGTSGSNITLLRDTDSFIPWVDQGPDGHLYYLVFSYQGSFGELRRLRYTGQIANQAPVINGTLTTPTTGQAPLNVSFSVDAYDPEGTPLSYDWDFGDGQSSDEAKPVHTYAEPGSYQARVAVSDGQFTTTSAPVTIQVGVAPTVNIMVPDNAKGFSAGDRFTLTAKANDRDSDLSAADVSWTVVFDHDDHSHPVSTATGATLTIDVPRTGHTFQGDTGFSVTATATDPDGLTATKTVSMSPKKIEVELGTNTPGATMVVDGIVQTTPFVVDTVGRFKHSVAAPSTVGSATFAGWADGGDRTRTIVAKSGASYRALFNAPPSERSANGLISLYTFVETDARARQGQVRDHAANGRRLNVKAAKPGNVNYDGHKLAIESGTRLVSTTRAAKVINALSSTNAFTVEAWIDPTQAKTGSQQVMTLAGGDGSTALSLGLQVGNDGAARLIANLSTSGNGTAGRVVKSAPIVVKADELHHVAITRTQRGAVRLFLNGEEVGRTKVPGSLAVARDHRLSLGSKVSGGSFFTGNLHLVAIFAKALKAEAIQRNYAAGPDPERTEN